MGTWWHGGESTGLDTLFGWWHRRTILALMGLDQDRLPRTPVARVDIGQGFQAYVKHPAEAKRPRGAAKHRLYIICTCGRHVTSGCMGQHLRSRGHQ